MKVNFSKGIKKAAIIIPTIAIIMIGFQNCGAPFEVNPDIIGSQGQSGLDSAFTPPTPILGLSVSNVRAKQTSDLVFQFVLRSAAPVATEVSFEAVSGSAVAGTDFLPTTGKVVIPAGELSASAVVPTLLKTRNLVSKSLSLMVIGVRGASSEEVVAQAQIDAAFEPAKFKKTIGGWRFYCGITPTDTVSCWGPGYQQIGGVTPFSIPGVTPVRGLTDVKDVIAGSKFVCALTSSGGVKCWGGSGYLANAPNVATATPTDVPGLAAGIKAISGNYETACAIDAGNRVMCWGLNRAGTLGNGTTVDSVAPVEVGGLGPAKQISVGAENACAILMDDTVRCWGSNQYGQLGNGVISDTPSLAPVSVQQLGTVKQVSVNNLSACAITMNNFVRCWGFGVLTDANGQLSNSAVPIEIAGLTDVKSIHGNVSSYCAITNQNVLKCWGDNGGAIGPNSTVRFATPVDVASGVKHVSLYYFSICYSAMDDTVRCTGQLLGADFEDLVSSSFIDSDSYSGVKRIESSTGHTCMIAANDSLKCFGSNSHGQLGRSGIESSESPLEVVGLTGVKEVAVGRQHACAISGPNATVKCWGSNVFGELGDGTVANSSSPVDIGLAGAKAISASYFSTCVISAQNTILCWGTNGASNAATSPVEVPGIIGAKAIAAGQWGHTCVITATDTVKCWGRNGFGQAGSATNMGEIPPSSPVDIVGLSNVASITLSGWSSCAVLKSGAMKCWGYNSAGQLGNPAFTGEFTHLPTDVVGLSGIKYAFARGEMACAVLSDDTSKCWGWDSVAGPTVRTPVSAFAGAKIRSLAFTQSSRIVFDVYGRVRIFGSIGGALPAGKQLFIPK